MSDWDREFTSNTYKQAAEYVKNHEIPVPEEPKGLKKLKLPSDVTKLTSEQLGKLMGEFAAVLSYIEFEVAKVNVERAARENRYKSLLKRQKLGGDKAPTDIEIEQAFMEAEKIKALYVLLDGIRGAHRTAYQALSRELTRRGEGMLWGGHEGETVTRKFPDKWANNQPRQDSK